MSTKSVMTGILAEYVACDVVYGTLYSGDTTQDGGEKISISLHSNSH